MADPKLSKSQQSFVRDVVQWREESGKTLAELSSKTRFSEDILSEFERSGQLFNPTFGRVYLRSLGAAYARCIGLPVDAMHEALDQAKANTYDGKLGRLLTEAEPNPAAAEGSAESERDAGQDEPVTIPSERLLPEREPSPKPRKRNLRLGMGSGRVLRGRSRMRRTGTVRGLRRQSRARDMARGRGVLIAGGFVVILVVVISMSWFIGRPFDRGRLPSWLSLGMARGDTATAVLPVESQDTAPELAISTTPLELPEVIHVIVVADSDKVEGAVVRMDDSERICWIEEGTARAFPVRERWALLSQSSRVRVTAAGFEVPIDPNTPSLELTRLELESGQFARALVHLPLEIDTVTAPRGC